MFTNPTQQDMLPCPYYLEGDCRFSDQQCRFSHGELVDLSALKEYKCVCVVSYSDTEHDSFLIIEQ
jgi:hypothetical protein